ncbi:MAG TPA: ABC transporter ATP-binding protein, partial [Longimicrobiales bacterium]|nr:ABC transporter ATP-binding protein [Trueperaceae bacterium]HKJ92554.1 ABC transporter ATP-binding protein [Longimicrobiales bacterium]
MLALDALTVSYGPVAALKGIDLVVQEGEAVALLGANGAGKSTTLRTVSGIVRPRRGGVRYRGKDIGRLDPGEIVGLGVAHCPEGRRVFAGMTVLENLKLGASRRRDEAGVRQDIARMEELFPVLGERRQQRAGTLSGGEQQMLAIARALMSRPRLLLLDEPSLGLAPLLVETIFDTLAELKRQGVTLLLVEQNARVALDLVDRALVLRTGNVVASGGAEELKRDPQVVEAYLGGGR